MTALRQRADAPEPSHETDRCPKCGSPLAFNTDPHGSGMTVEQCSRLPQCDHWRTLETVKRPALLPPPRGEKRGGGAMRDTGKRSYRVSNAPGGLRTAILAVLPTDASRAIGARDVAMLSQQSLASVHTRLGQLANDGTIERRRVGRSAFYWRAA